MNDVDQAMRDYFGEKPKIAKSNVVIEKDLSQAPGTYTHQQEQDGVNPEKVGEIVGSSRDDFLAAGRMSTIEEMAALMLKIMNASWGSKWGTFAHATSVNIELEEILLPLIVYDTLTRTPLEGTNPKGTLFNTIKEIVDGKPTGDMIQLHKFFYECVVEFTFFGNNSAEAADLMNRFEALIRTTTYMLKQKGLGELVFMKEQPADESSKYTADIPMRSLLYYVKLERTDIVKTSMLRKIELELEME